MKRNDTLQRCLFYRRLAPVFAAGALGGLANGFAVWIFVFFFSAVGGITAAGWLRLIGDEPR